MILRIFLILNALIFVAVNPVIEVSETHLFSPHWSGHARLHNAWQLIANAFLSGFALHLVLRQNAKITGGIIALSVPGTFVVAYFLKDLFGGSMKYADGTQLLILGTNPALGICIILTLGLAIGLIIERSRP